MSDWFDILYRREEPQAAAFAEPVAEACARGSESMAVGGGSSAPPPRGQLKSAPPLPRMPSRWVLELQKAAFLLGQATDQATGSRVVVFSGLQRESGVSTVSYLVAHYLAAEKPDRRVLHVDFSMEKKRSGRQGSDIHLKIGQEVSDAIFVDSSLSLTRLSIRPGEEGGASNCSRWFCTFIELSRRHCDWVIVDAPPFFSTPESYSLSQSCDGVVLLLKSGATRYPALNGLVADLEQVGIKVLGAIMNFRRYPIPQWLLQHL